MRNRSGLNFPSYTERLAWFSAPSCKLSLYHLFINKHLISHNYFGTFKKNHAEQEGGRDAPLYEGITSVVKGITRAAIWVSEKV